MPHLLELKQERAAALDAAEAIVKRAESGKRALTTEEQTLFEAHSDEVKRLNARIKPIEDRNTLRPGEFGLFGVPAPTGQTVSVQPSAQGEDPRATAFRNNFAAWMNNALSAVDGGTPKMAAAAPTGVISVGSGTGLDSIALTVPTEILPYLPSYYSLDSFGLAGATTFFTDHTRPLFKPVLSAGAPDSVYAENAAPGTSEPLGLSGFTFGGTKYSRLVLASYESLMNSELPLQGAILDELMATLATTLTTASTTAMYAALTAASTSLQVGNATGADIYTSLIDLRHAVPPRFDLPTNKWMLSRATLATIRNKRASTSGVPMFDPNTNQILGRDFVVNDNFDSICGAGFVAFGSWADGCFLRRTPVMSRVFQELYAQNGQIGFRTTQWADAHFLAELVGAPQPPSFQPLYYTSLATES